MCKSGDVPYFCELRARTRSPFLPHSLLYFAGFITSGTPVLLSSYSYLFPKKFLSNCSVNNHKQVIIPHSFWLSFLQEKHYCKYHLYFRSFLKGICLLNLFSLFTGNGVERKLTKNFSHQSNLSSDIKKKELNIFVYLFDFQGRFCQRSI